MSSKKLRNTRQIEITPTDPKEKPYVVQGKGRNSVSQKVFGVRAFRAIQSGLVSSIKEVQWAEENK